MTDERAPHQIIDEMAAAYAQLSDVQVLAELAAIPGLSDESDPCWLSEEYWHRVAYPYLALWNVAAARRLSAAVPLILDRACLGDPGEIMRNMRHAIEAVYGPDWSALTACCVTALRSHRPGTRFWAADELGVLRDAAAIPTLEVATRDEFPEVRNRATEALEATRGG